MKILITGGCGYIGTELVSCLLKDDSVDEIRVYDNLCLASYSFFSGARGFENRVRFIEADILDSHSLEKAMKGVDMVYHLAAIVGGTFHVQQSSVFEQVNQWGTAEVSYAVERSQVQRLVHMSSASVYGTSSEDLTETSSLRPETPYGVSKMNGEKYITRLFQAIEGCCVLRCSNVFGLGRSMRMDGVINRFMFDATYRRKITVHGSGLQQMSFIEVKLLATRLARLVQSKPLTGIYNVSEFSASLKELADFLASLYEDLEMIFADQDMPVRNTVIRPNPELMNSKTHCLERSLESFSKEMVQ